MAGTAARLAAGGSGDLNGTKVDMKGFRAQGGNPFDINGMKEYSAAQNAEGQGGIDDGSTAGVAPAPITGAPVDAGGTDQFAGKKFEISPVQMKGSFSNKSKENARGVYGDEDERKNSLKR